MTVVVTSRTSTAAGEAVARDIDGHYLQADLADANEAGRLPQRAVELTGRLDVLINNAAITATVPHNDLAGATPELWRRMLDINLLAPWLLITGAEDHLRRSPIGCVVNVTSHAGVRPKGASIPYAAIKAALGHATKLLAVALAPDIRVNAVAPGLVDTPMTADWTAAQTLWRERAPMRRAAKPVDVADLIAALVHNSYITGEIVLLDGGLNLT